MFSHFARKQQRYEPHADHQGFTSKYPALLTEVIILALVVRLVAVKRPIFSVVPGRIGDTTGPEQIC
jgi:hypothetical protein